MEYHKAQILGSVVAGLFSTVLGHPLDTVKTHLQTNPKLNKSMDVAIALRFGLFRGMAPPLVNAMIMNSVMFSVFDTVEAKVNNPFVSGIMSGFATAIISTPTDYIKIQMQLSSGQRRSTMISILEQEKNVGQYTNVVNKVRKLYRGFTLNLAREGIFTMVYLGIYHWVITNAKNNSEEFGDELKSFNRVLIVAGTSAITGAMAWVASYPFDVAKTMIQSGNTFEQVRELWRRHAVNGRLRGISAFYKGCLPSTGRAMLVTSSRMIAYDLVIRCFAKTT